MAKPTQKRPKSEAEIAEIVGEAKAKSRGIEIVGGGTRPLGNPVQSGMILQMASLDEITLYEPGALTIAARAGTPVEKIEKALAKQGQHLPFEVPDYRGVLSSKGVSTIGGAVATGSAGPRRIQSGSVRDAMIGVRFISGEGKIIKNGGRVMKNVTGYDLVKPMAGAHGTLGVLTEIVFKILPKPEKAATILIYGLDDETAIKKLSSALASPFDVSGAAHAPKGVDGHPVTMIRIEGFEKSVRYRADALKTLLGRDPPKNCEIHIETKAKKIAAGWQWLRDCELFHNSTKPLWRISLKPSDGSKLALALKDKGDCKLLYDWGGGLVWAETEIAADFIRAEVDRYGGHATLFRPGNGSEKIPVFHPQSSSVERLSAGLRGEFDPARILNPGRMGQ